MIHDFRLMDHALSHCLAAISGEQSEPTLLEIALAVQPQQVVPGQAESADWFF
jgi:hypothetical protein